MNAELWPIASEEFEIGPPQLPAIELARIIDRTIRESGFVNLKKLCIKKGELVWMVFIDIYPINDDGNLIDASALAAVAALQNTVFPVLKEDKVDYGNLTTEKLPLNETPIAITLYKINDSFILDPTTLEEEAVKARITIGMTLKENWIHAVQKGGDSPLTEEEIEKAIEIAFSTGREVLEKLQKVK